MAENVTTSRPATIEHYKLYKSQNRSENWLRWGPYLSERQWGTVREDYSPDGTCWDYFPHDHARSRAYRWGEDGLMGFTDRECRLCFSVALWNEKDPILKERLFGLNGNEGNHGEDVKECYYYLDSSPSHSYVKFLYKYPQCEYPYEELLNANQSAGRLHPEVELTDLGVFNENRYFDVFTEYAKVSTDDILIRITAHNRGPETATLHLLPTLLYRNLWSWGSPDEACELKPLMKYLGENQVQTLHGSLGEFLWTAEQACDQTQPEFLFTDNETNFAKVFSKGEANAYSKDAFHRAIVDNEPDAVNPAQTGTKVAAHYRLTIPAGESRTVSLRLASKEQYNQKLKIEDYAQVFNDRIGDTNDFYESILPPQQTPEERNISRQAYAGLLISKQFYNFVVKDWLEGDPSQPAPPERRFNGRNIEWKHLHNRDVISMPDKWEYPWYAAWDLAFHMIPFARVDPNFAQEQLILFLREWYMHPNGQIPAYEFAFGDVNPPVHAWACWRVYKMSGPIGKRNITFLKRVFYKLLLNFTWWVNRKDPTGKNLFSGGFLGLDNIGVFDRSRPLPSGHFLEQADGTAWMASYCLTMLSISMELAIHDGSFEDIASKFFEHFIEIVDSMNTLGGSGLWDEQDGFYYDQVRTAGQSVPLRVRSMVGLIPLNAVLVLEQRQIDMLPGFKKRLDWFIQHRPDLSRHISHCQDDSHLPDRNNGRGLKLLALPSRERLERVLKYLLDENEFLSDYGIRAMSRFHKNHPVEIQIDGQSHGVSYEPADSTSGMFGGNSNWRGPIWFPVNYLLIESLEQYYHFYGDDLKVEFPTGSGNRLNLLEVSRKIADRLTGIFKADEHGRRPANGENELYQSDPHWSDLVLFYEFFDGDHARGLGASHQTGWTALITELLESQAWLREESL